MTGAHELAAQAIESEVDSESVREFGGPWSVVGIMTASHVILYYLWIAWRDYGGTLVHPEGFSDVGPFLGGACGSISRPERYRPGVRY